MDLYDEARELVDKELTIPEAEERLRKLQFRCEDFMRSATRDGDKKAYMKFNKIDNTLREMQIALSDVLDVRKKLKKIIG